MRAVFETKTKDIKATYYPKGELVFAFIDEGGKEKSKSILAYMFTIRTSKPKDLKQVNICGRKK